jgi:hypothetical protein
MEALRETLRKETIAHDYPLRRSQKRSKGEQTDRHEMEQGRGGLNSREASFLLSNR